jgi:hypothetical protein
MKFNPREIQLIRFLREHLRIPSDSIAVALRHYERDPGPLPMILWQYGLVTLQQLEQIFEWQGDQTRVNP